MDEGLCDLFLAVLVRVEVEDHERPGSGLAQRHDVFLTDRMCLGSAGLGSLSRHGSSITMLVPVPSQDSMLTGNTTGRTTPPVSAPVTAAASADAVNWLIPMARANVVPNA